MKTFRNILLLSLGLCLAAKIGNVTSMTFEVDLKKIFGKENNRAEN